jgi:hypothetical protein
MRYLTSIQAHTTPHPMRFGDALQVMSRPWALLFRQI